MAARWVFYDADGSRVRPGAKQARFKGKEVSADSGVPAPPGHAALGRVHYVDVHPIAGGERRTFTSAAKFKAWCRKHG